tara:strand:+ start:192 stop:662 length:471 start_codon:yes stop_codon:yes gene_type:complete
MFEMVNEIIMSVHNTLSISWSCYHTWFRASKNTSWCLLGCCIGDFGTIAFFQFSEITWPVLAIMSLAIVNGILTSIALETFILSRQMSFNIAFKTAIGMSVVSMISMEIAMNITDVVFTGGAILTWWVIPLMLIAGFITPLPYNYWRLKALGKACH